MRCYHAGVGVLALMMTGCPSEFGKDGRVDKAVRQDSEELVQKHCPQDKFDRYCSEGREHTPECLQECG
jgi:hypothetical protein